MSARRRTKAPPQVEDWSAWVAEADEVGEDWLDKLAALLPYLRASRARAMEAAHGSPSLLDLHAFLSCLGTSEEIAQRGRELAATLRWWEAGGPLDPEDLRATDGLALALDRLWDLYCAALWIEERVAEHGYYLHPTDRLLKERRTGPGERPTLLAEEIGRVYDELVQSEEWDPKQDAALRDEIRSRLSLTFHPDLLSTDRGSLIYSTVNARLNPDRH